MGADFEITEKDREQYAIINREYKNEYVTIDNAMIRAREKTNLLESKIEILAIHHLDRKPQQREKIDTVGNHYQVSYIVLSAKEIKQLMGRNDGDAYEDIRNAAMNLKEKMLIIEDKRSHQFVLRSMYGDVAYSNGALYIEFNNDVQDLFLDMKEKFTKLSLPILFSFKKNGGFQLYKVLKSYAFAPNIPAIDMSLSQEELPVYKISYDVTDLRMILGYIDITQDKLKREASKKNPDFEKMAKEEKNPQYKRWSDFNTRVIEPGVKEINAISDIYIAEVVKNSAGRGGRVISLDFYIQHNKAYYEKTGNISKKTPTATAPIEPDEQTKNDIQDWLEDALIDINVNLRSRQLRSICEAAGYDRKRLSQALDILESYHKDIPNITGFLISAIKERWELSSRQDNKDYNVKFNDECVGLTVTENARYWQLFEKVLLEQEMTQEESAEYGILKDKRSRDVDEENDVVAQVMSERIKAKQVYCEDVPGTKQERTREDL